MTTCRTLAFALLLSLPVPALAQTAAEAARIDRILKRTPLIDGHNDWAEALVDKAGDARWTLDLNRLDPKDYDTDIERLRRGRVGGQFWSVYVSASLPGLEQVKATLEQIDLVKRLALRYPQHFTLARTAADVRAAHRAGRIASLIGAEGGGQIDESLSVLRAYHDLGVGYLTLTHFKSISWADSATDDPKHGPRGGLTEFGKTVVREMNRLGMLVDLSHVSEGVMRDALLTSAAPVIFSHSSARALCDHTRNVPDDVLRLVAKNGGIVMVNFAPQYILEARRLWGGARAAEEARGKILYTGEPDRAKAAMAAWLTANPEPRATVATVADHVERIARIAGHDHVGLGGDYDGLAVLPEGMDGVESYPRLFAELIHRGWTDAELAKLAGGNILRVMEGAEEVARGMRGWLPATARPAKP
ncbi:dipeptidase [Sphingobium sufflavum]|uniref:dipeptidase n=1 Tax=Sphingobium sufflavum TaxID=1129547 RepID=UPI001F1681DD|nr:dipeptidase [Sphingobium sufflavum]MCE7795674.1 dipeptidase [Sphingobium sufflavum]